MYVCVCVCDSELSTRVAYARSKRRFGYIRHA